MRIAQYAQNAYCSIRTKCARRTKPTKRTRKEEKDDDHDDDGDDDDKPSMRDGHNAHALARSGLSSNPRVGVGYANARNRTWVYDAHACVHACMHACTHALKYVHARADNCGRAGRRVQKQGGPSGCRRRVDQRP
eukprot:1666576-Pleurochrysis_carterae.AAC.5